MGNRYRPDNESNDAYEDDGSRIPEEVEDQAGVDGFLDEEDGGASGSATAGAGTAVAAGSGASGIATGVSESESGESDSPTGGEDEVKTPAEPAEPQPPKEESDKREADDQAEEPDTPDTPEDPEQRRPRTSDPDADPDHHDENEKDGDEGEDEEDNEPELSLTHFSDPYCVGSWQALPLLTRLEVLYGEQVDFTKQMVGPRKFGSPAAMREHWEAMAAKHGIPVDASVWKANPPESSTSAIRAYLAAGKQGVEAGDDLLRNLRLGAMAEARDLTDMDELKAIADEVGLDVNQFQADIAKESVRASDENVTTPVFKLEANTIETATFYHPTEDLEAAFLAAGVTPTPPPRLREFVADYGPVATEEVMAVYDWGKAKAVDALQQNAVEVFEDAAGRFWGVE